MPSAAARARKTASFRVDSKASSENAPSGPGGETIRIRMRIAARPPRTQTEAATRGGGRDRGLPVGAAEAQDRGADRDHDRQHQEERDHFHRLPGVAAA